MEGYHDVVHHTHEFVIHGGQVHVMCHEVTNGPCGVAQTQRERCRGAPSEVFRGERFPSGKLRHDVGEREGEARQVLPGRLGSYEGVELAL